MEVDYEDMRCADTDSCSGLLRAGVMSTFWFTVCTDDGIDLSQPFRFYYDDECVDVDWSALF